MSKRYLTEKYWRPDIALLVGALALSAAIFVINSITLNNLREERIGSAEANLKSQATALAEEADRSFKMLDLALSAVGDQIARLEITDGASLQQRLKGIHIHELLKERSGGWSHVDAIGVVGLDGRLVNSSRLWPIPETDVSDRDYFRAFLSDAKLMTFIGQPTRNRINKRWSIYLARRLSAPNGDFAGLVLGTITLEYIEKFFEFDRRAGRQRRYTAA